MSVSATYEAKTEALLLPICSQLGVDLYDIEYVKEADDYILRAFISKAGGIYISDCEAVSRALEAKLDAADFIDSAYILEVSSPGITRQLSKDKHLEKSLGEYVEIKTFAPLAKEEAATKTKKSKKKGKKPDSEKSFCGTLKAFDKESIHLDSADGEMSILRKDIAVVRLKPSF